MKKISLIPAVLIVFAILSVAALLNPIFQGKRQSDKSDLAVATEAAFLKLDARIAKCTQSVYQLEVTDPSKPIAPLLENLGDYHYPVTTNNEKAQQFFDQGLRLTYAFNHAEAHRAFMEAARLDPECAMAYWGQAYDLGPNINDPVPDAQRKLKAYEAVQKALGLSKNASPKEKDLITALSHRYSNDTTADLNGLNKAYAGAMKEVAAKYPGDPDVLTLYGESLMDTMPWNYWDPSGNPNPGTSDAKAALENALKLNRNHPGANHYYIHMMELPNPDLAVANADRLGKLMPAAGHLVHMPAHIYIRVGRYEDAARANVAAIAADEDYIAQCRAQGLYPLGYYPHNIHFLWSSSSMLGDRGTAIESAKKVAEKVPVGLLNQIPFFQEFLTTPLLAYTRFGDWNQILTIPDPGEEYKHYNLIWHYARGIAFVRKNNLEAAGEELSALQEMLKDSSLSTLFADQTNPSSAIGAVAEKVLEGEIAAANGDFDKAIEVLKDGVENEDKLAYNEPVAWHIPVRQTLGVILLEANQPTEAEKIYEEDLKINRENGWSLKGLYNSLIAQDKIPEAAEVNRRFEKAWENADIKIDASIL